MAIYRVMLTVEMEATLPENAVEMVADMAGGWTYTVKNMSNNNETTVHLEHGKPVEMYDTPTDLRSDYRELQ